jgi:hypothetical protein
MQIGIKVFVEASAEAKVMNFQIAQHFPTHLPHCIDVCS